MNDAVIVSGIGMTTPLGSGKEVSWQRIKKGDSLLTEELSDQLGKEFSPFVRFSPFINPDGLHRIFPLALSAVQEAIGDSQLNLSAVPQERVGCSVSVSKPIFLPPVFPSVINLSPPNSVVEFLSRTLKISGPAQNVVAACATGIYSISTALRWLNEKKCDLAIAGSVESSLHPLYISGFQKMGVLSHFPCPFDKRRKGFLMGEGAGILILERKRDALSRKAKIYGEILSCAMGSDFTHPTAFAPDGSSIASVLNRAIEQAKSSVQDIAYINLHGTGTLLNDLIETRAVKKVFGKNSAHISLSSTKSATGHLLGAAGSVEAAICCLAIRDQFVPPTAHLELPDPDCDLDYTPLKGKTKPIDIAVSLSFGFGGSIGAIVVKKP